MKKLVIIAAVAFASVCANAANLQWGIRNIYIPIADNLEVDQTGIHPTSGDKFAAGSLTVNLFWVDNDGVDHAINSYVLTGAGTISAQTLANTSDNTALYNAMLAEGDTYKPTYHYTATYETSTGVYTYDGTAASGTAISNLPNGNNSLTVNAANNGTGTWSYTANAVPEPTSAMLVLLGVAGLALRRRRA